MPDNRSVIPPRGTPLVQGAVMHPQWYRSIEDIYQHSGLAGVKFPLYQDLVVLGPQMLADASPPGFDSFTGNLRAWAFDSSAAEYLFFAVQLPHAYVDGQGIRPWVQWASSSSGAGAVRWSLEYAWASIEENFTASVIAVNSTASAVALRHQYVEFDADISADGKTMSSVLICRVGREAAHGDDTYGDDAFLLSCGFHFLNGGLGTVKKWPG